LEGGKDIVNQASIKLASVTINQPLNNCGAKSSTDSKGFIAVFLLGFLGGFIALLTPCVFPMIPLTVSFLPSVLPTESRLLKTVSFMVSSFS